MLSETCATGKPVDIYPLPRSVFSRYIETPGNLLAKSGLINPPRDMSRLHQQLIEQGHAVYLGDNPDTSISWVPDDLNKAVDRVRSMMMQA